jgi:hypothetical protein
MTDDNERYELDSFLSRRSTCITYRSGYEIANDILHIVAHNPVIKRRHQAGIGYAARLTC